VTADALTALFLRSSAQPGTTKEAAVVASASENAQLEGLLAEHLKS